MRCIISLWTTRSAQTENEAFSLSCCPGEHPIRRKADEDLWNLEPSQQVTFDKLTQPAPYATGELCQRVFGVEGAMRFESWTVFGWDSLEENVDNTDNLISLQFQELLDAPEQSWPEEVNGFTVLWFLFLFSNEPMTWSRAQLQRLRRMAFLEPFWKRLLGALSTM